MKDYKIEKKNNYWHVTLSHGCYSDYTEYHYFFAGNSEEEVWSFLCAYIEDSIEKTREFLWGSARMALKFGEKQYLSPKFIGDKEDIDWNNDYDINNVTIEMLDVIYFQKIPTPLTK